MGKNAIKDEDYALNKKSYAIEFKKVYSREFKPKHIIQFPVLLPFHVPVKSGTCVTAFYKKNALNTLHFSDVFTNARIDPGITTPEPISIPIIKSRVEMIFVSKSEINSDDGKSLTYYFDILLDFLNSILVSYIVLKKDFYMHRVTKEMFQFSSAFRHIKIKGWKTINCGLFFLNMNIPYKTDILSEKEHVKLIHYADVISRRRNPFILSEEIAMNSKRNLATGFFRESTINIQTCIEVFLKTLYQIFLIMENKSKKEIQDILEKSPFMKMVRCEFENRLGGEWDISKENSTIGLWYNKTYKLRNRIAHEGYIPNYEETNEAVYHAIEFRLYIVSLIKSQKIKYPSLQKYFIEEDF